MSFNNQLGPASFCHGLVSITTGQSIPSLQVRSLLQFSNGQQAPASDQLHFNLGSMDTHFLNTEPPMTNGSSSSNGVKKALQMPSTAAAESKAEVASAPVTEVSQKMEANKDSADEQNDGPRLAVSGTSTESVANEGINAAAIDATVDALEKQQVAKSGLKAETNLEELLEDLTFEDESSDQLSPLPSELLWPSPTYFTARSGHSGSLHAMPTSPLPSSNLHRAQSSSALLMSTLTKQHLNTAGQYVQPLSPNKSAELVFQVKQQIYEGLQTLSDLDDLIFVRDTIQRQLTLTSQTSSPSSDHRHPSGPLELHRFLITGQEPPVTPEEVLMCYRKIRAAKGKLGHQPRGRRGDAALNAHLSHQNSNKRNARNFIDPDKLKYCGFCKTHCDHRVKDLNGNVECPKLFQQTCPICGAHGPTAHTKRHCPRAQDAQDASLSPHSK